MTGALVSDNFFHALGVNAALGRVLTPADSDEGGAQVIVLSHPAWKRWFASDPSIVGRLVRINGAAFEIAGVAREGFRGLAIGAPDYWAPIEHLGHFRRAPAGHESEVEVLSAIAAAVTATLPPEILETIEFTIPAVDWRVIVFQLIAAIAATALFGLVPAPWCGRNCSSD
jgi:hypothetical protein